TNNTLAGKQYGIYIKGAATLTSASISITSNTINHHSRYTDAYGIGISDLPAGITVVSNTINTTLGRGILCDQFSADCLNYLIHDNTLSVYEQPNLEYGFGGLEVTALRIRNASANLKSTGWQIYNNTCKASTDANGVHAAIGFRISNGSKTQALNWSIHDNT